MLELAIHIGAGLLCAYAGWHVGTRRTLMQLAPWNSLRLMKVSGDALDGFGLVETRDAGRASRLSRLVYGREFRYIVRRFDSCGQVTEDFRYNDPHVALDMHTKLASEREKTNDAA